MRARSAARVSNCARRSRASCQRRTRCAPHPANRSAQAEIARNQAVWQDAGATLKVSVAPVSFQSPSLFDAMTRNV